MSVKYKHRTDSISETLANMIEFNNMKGHLLTKDLETFIRWFDKLRMYDARSTWIYLLENKDELTEDEIEWVERKYKRKLEKRKDVPEE